MAEPGAKNGPHSLRQRLKRWADANSLSLYAAGLLLLLAALALAPAVVVAVPAGSVGVLWHRFGNGTVTDHVLEEGTHVIAPWDQIYIYDSRLQTLTRTYPAVAANGLTMEVEMSVRFRINPHAAGLVHKLAGPDYADTLVRPKIASLLYEFVSQHSPEEFYSLNRAEIQAYLLKRDREEFPLPTRETAPDTLTLEEQMASGHGPALVRVEDILISSVTLPDSVRAAIERKAEQQQIMQEYDFRLAREAKERDRKRIEAEGIRDFQATVANTITPEYLRLRGIEATSAFATSPNAKTIIIGGRDGLPVILNTGDDGHPQEAPKPAAEDHSRAPAPRAEAAKPALGAAPATKRPEPTVAREAAPGAANAPANVSTVPAEAPPLPNEPTGPAADPPQR
ncbi:prohibitin family protein [Nitrospirillum amazonense]|nr:prohibitin family protein [Nitrospirillum amazonense]